MKKLVITAIAGLGLFVGGTVVSADETHVVQSSDTLSGLAETYHTTIERLMAWNEAVTNPDLIFDGEILIVAKDDAQASDESSNEVYNETPVTEAYTETESGSQEPVVSQPTSGSGVLNAFDGVNYYNGVRETYYSQKVLAGGGLNIPGRHVASDGTIRDGDGYIVVASDMQGKGSTGQSSLGAYKVYDTGVGHSGIDVYTNW